MVLCGRNCAPWIPLGGVTFAPVESIGWTFESVHECRATRSGSSYTSGVVLSHGKSLVAPRPGHTWCVPGVQPYLALNSSRTPGSVTSPRTWSCGLSGPGASGQFFHTDSGTGRIACG